MSEQVSLVDHVGGDTGMKAIGGTWRVQVRIACREVLVTHTGLGFS